MTHGVVIVIAVVAAIATPAAAFVFDAHPTGPAPTASSIEGNGPYTVASYVPSTSPGYGGGTVYHPTGTTDGPFAAISISPGYTASQSSVSWLGPRLASHGFVVITIDTNSIFNFPESRADQLVAALDHVAAQSAGATPVSGLVDPERRGVMGHSMGGGGALIAAANDPSIDAAVPLAPWAVGEDFSGITVPTLVVGCELDLIAPTGIHAEPFYEDLGGERAYLEVDNASHSCPSVVTTHRPLIGKYVISWMKRWLDQDVRYGPFLCGAPHADDLASFPISDYRDSCAYDVPHVVTPGGVGATEGPFGFSETCVPISLDRPAEYPVRIEWETFDPGGAGVATAGADYIPASGSLEIPVGQTEACATVTLVGDDIVEPPLLWGEWLFVRFHTPSVNNTLDLSFFGLGVAVIIDDD